MEKEQDQNQNNEQNNEQEQKAVPYARFKEVLEKSKQTEQEFKTFKEQLESDRKKTDEQKLVDEKNYKELVTRVETERTQEKNKLHGFMRNTYLSALGLKHGIAKTEYVNLFSGDIQIESLEIKNAAEVEQAFAEFKKDNPNLFTTVEEKKEEKKQVPKTDSKKPEKVLSNAKPSGYDMIRMGLEKKN